ncbi:Isochorismatase family protein [Bosea lupini]|uniref:nicotinamidase n=1 Tax=Bosea lupini TaxID=1036779 RepID=A0A1H7FTX9_9HYPH|nr:Isochorismatase family protein [Bosea lupini]
MERRCCGRIIASRAARARPSIRGSTFPWRRRSSARGCHSKVDSYSGLVEADRTTPTGLGGYLRERGIARVVLAGLATDFCVSWTAQDAARQGFETIVVEEACRAIDLDGSLDRAWAEMTALGVRRARLTELNG